MSTIGHTSFCVISIYYVHRLSYAAQPAWAMEPGIRISALEKHDLMPAASKYMVPVVSFGKYTFPTLPDFNIPQSANPPSQVHPAACHPTATKLLPALLRETALRGWRYSYWISDLQDIIRILQAEHFPGGGRSLASQPYSSRYPGCGIAVANLLRFVFTSALNFQSFCQAQVMVSSSYAWKILNIEYSRTSFNFGTNYLYWSVDPTISF